MKGVLSQSQNHTTPIHGFTVVEVIMVLALLAAIAGLVIVNFPNLEKAFSKRNEFDTARLAVREAHSLARETRNNIALSFYPEKQEFLINDLLGQTLARFAFPPGASASVTFRRLKPEPKPSAEPAWEGEDIPVSTVMFSSTGPSTPFAMELETQTRFHRLIFDPFSHDTWSILDQ